MKFEHTIQELASYTASQLNNFYPDGRSVSGTNLIQWVRPALERTEFCFQRIAWPTYSESGEAKFNLLHSDQYCTYLYFLANTIYRESGDMTIASKTFCLNKALHAFNCMYDTQLPDIFWVVHTVGIVLGKAQYSNYLVVRQNCTVGALRGEYPVLGEKLILSAGASIIGTCHIGDNVMIGPGCTILKQDIPGNTLVTTQMELTMCPNSDRPINAHFLF